MSVENLKVWLTTWLPQIESESLPLDHQCYEKLHLELMECVRSFDITAFAVLEPHVSRLFQPLVPCVQRLFTDEALFNEGLVSAFALLFRLMLLLSPHVTDGRDRVRRLFCDQHMLFVGQCGTEAEFETAPVQICLTMQHLYVIDIVVHFFRAKVDGFDGKTENSATESSPQQSIWPAHFAMANSGVAQWAIVATLNADTVACGWWMAVLNFDVVLHLQTPRLRELGCNDRFLAELRSKARASAEYCRNNMVVDDIYEQCNGGNKGGLWFETFWHVRTAFRYVLLHESGEQRWRSVWKSSWSLYLDNARTAARMPQIKLFPRDFLAALVALAFLFSQLRNAELAADFLWCALDLLFVRPALTRCNVKVILGHTVEGRSVLSLLLQALPPVLTYEYSDVERHRYVQGWRALLAGWSRLPGCTRTENVDTANADTAMIPGGSIAHCDNVSCNSAKYVAHVIALLSAAVDGVIKSGKCDNCAVCDECGALTHQWCGRCFCVAYCSSKCQDAGWRAHRRDCKKFVYRLGAAAANAAARRLHYAAGAAETK